MWVEREAVTYALCAFCNVQVRKILAILEAGSDDRNLMASFKSQVSGAQRARGGEKAGPQFLGCFKSQVGRAPASRIELGLYKS